MATRPIDATHINTKAFYAFYYKKVEGVWYVWTNEYWRKSKLPNQTLNTLKLLRKRFKYNVESPLLHR